MRPEDRLRARARMYLDRALPDPGYYSAIEHGQKLRGDAQQRQRQWGHLKAQGVKTGLADVFIWYLRLFIPIELKVGTKQRTSQEAFEAAMRANGFDYYMAWSIVEIDNILRANGIPIEPSMRILAMQYDAALGDVEPVKKRAPSRPQIVKPTTASIRRSESLRDPTKGGILF